MSFYFLIPPSVTHGIKNASYTLRLSCLSLNHPFFKFLIHAPRLAFFAKTVNFHTMLRHFKSVFFCQTVFILRFQTNLDREILLHDRHTAWCTWSPCVYSYLVNPSASIVERRSSPFFASASQLRYTVERLSLVSLFRTASYTSPAVIGRLFWSTFKIMTRAFVRFKCFF